MARSSMASWVGPSGAYEAGALAADQWPRLPAEAMNLVTQLVLWLPHDNRLYWLLAELVNVNGDFSTAEYLRLQAVVHRVGEAVRHSVPTERLYILSLGSQQGNWHVHWHVVPCPVGPPSAYGHLAAFLRQAPEQQRHVLWHRVGSKMTQHREGWAVFIHGDNFDLDDLRRELAPPFDPWVEGYARTGDSPGLLLRSKVW